MSWLFTMTRNQVTYLMVIIWLIFLETNHNEKAQNGEHEPKDENSTPPEKESVPFGKLLYTFATPGEKFAILLGILLSMASGGTMPAFMIIFGKMINNFGGSSAGISSFVNNINDTCTNFVYIGLGIMAVTASATIIWSTIGRNITRKIKNEYFKAIMRQEQNWFDQFKNKYEFATKVETQTKTIEIGLGPKVGNLIMGVTMFTASVIVGFCYSWKMSLVMISTYPALLIAAVLMVRAITKRLADAQSNFETAGGIAEELLYSIKTVISFSNFNFEKERFDSAVDECLTKGKESALRNGFGMGFLYLCIFGAYALAIWYGASLLIAGGELNSVSGSPFGPGDVITVLFATIMGAFSLGMAAPNLKSITDACSSAIEFFETYERVPVMCVENSNLQPPKDNIRGVISFRDVKFSYPSRATENVFEGLNLNFNSGEKTAIVGESGSGKTTIIHLLERLYDIQGGVITLDGIDITNIDLYYHRSVIGYVAQEPVLFNTSIRENILFGRNFSDEEIYEVILF